ncbi:GSCOCG00008715001-RA-CDS [Cotesia congregata]|nr:GSCOCG00008715001-RA-CDS [Cotesia congregata]
MFPSKPRSWCNSTVGPIWYFNLNISLDQLFSSCRNDTIICTVNNKHNQTFFNVPTQIVSSS